MKEAIRYIVKSNVDSLCEVRFGNKNHFEHEGYNYEISLMMLRYVTKDVNVLMNFVDVSKLYRCAWCGEYNYSIIFSFKLLKKEERIRKSYKETTYTLVVDNFSYYTRRQESWNDITLRSPDEQFSKYKCTKNKKCPRNKLNSNSIEYTAKSFGISDFDANQLILERNSSPFYITNYTDKEEYRKYQNHGYDDLTAEQRAELINRQNYSRSLDGYIEKYGRELGKELWKDVQRRKGITPHSMIEKYGAELGREKYDMWLTDTRHTYDKFVERYGEEIAYEKWTRYKALQDKSYGNLSYTDKGELLRSDNEKAFYDAMKLYNLHYEDYMIERNYPNSNLLSDFYFVKLNMHIEIAGMSGDAYWSRMKYKQEKFGAIILIPTKTNIMELCESIHHRLNNENI